MCGCCRISVFDLRSSSTGDAKYMSLGTPVMPNPMMIPQRTIYTPQQPGAAVSLLTIPLYQIIAYLISEWNKCSYESCLL